MTIIGLVLLLAMFLLTVLLLYVVKMPKNILLMANMAEDEDIKIAGSSFGKDPQANEEAAEKAAEEFLRQKEKGNIDQARHLGEAYAEALWKVAQELIMNEKEDTKVLASNKLMLYGFVINKIVATASPTPLLAQATLSAFTKRVEELSGVLQGYISDTGAMSLYMLRAGDDNSQEIGEIFATLCGDGENGELVSIGNDAYSSFSRTAKKMFDDTVNYTA